MTNGNANAIEKTKGPCVILAGAGTGKTYTIVEKMKYIIEKGICEPDKIVCITFSNEAANNLILRVEKIFNNMNNNGIVNNNGIIRKPMKPIIRTFHGFSADLLRLYGDKIGINKEFKILDPDQAKVILHRNLKVNPGNCHKYISTIGTAKDLGIKINEFEEYLKKESGKYSGIDIEKRLENLSFELQTLHLQRYDRDKKKELVREIKKLRSLMELKKFVSAWNAYEKLKQKGNYQDYSDLNANALLLLEKNPEIAMSYRYVIVDEFQDTNKLQLDFLIRLAPHSNITVVGDLNQSIYRFRGAYKENLNLFKSAFNVSNKDIFNLDKSYRSPNKVLRTAHRLIGHNYQNPEDSFFVENISGREGDNLEVYEMKDSNEEARKVVEIVKEQISLGTPLEEICIMFRAHQHGRIIKKALEQEGIAYYSVSKASLLKQKSVKTAYDFLRIIEKLKKKEKGGDDAWWDIVYLSDFSQDDLIKIGKTIKEFSGKNRQGMNGSAGNTDNAINNMGGVGVNDGNNKNGKELISVYLFNNLHKLELSENGKMAAKILIDKIKLMLNEAGKPISQLVQEVARIAGLIGEQRTREGKESFANLSKFIELAKTHEELYDSDLSNFLYYLQILDNLGIEIEASQLEESGVRLMTSHATKGLEYKMVIITNMAQGRFPIERYVGNGLIPTELLPEVKNELNGLSDEDKDDYVIAYERQNQLLEERRLAYVSFTRAKEKLILTFADEYGNKKTLPSIFLNEIDFKNNGDIKFIVDNSAIFEEKPEARKRGNLLDFINAADFEEKLRDAVKSGGAEKKEHSRFSPSALILFDNCQKQFEYKYVYNMPERKTISWEAMRLGSFVHLVLEKGVSSGAIDVQGFLELARELSMDEDWESVEIGEAETLIKVFFERHRGRYNEQSKTEQYLPLQLEGMDFIGFADRIDLSDSGAVIVDYKTGKTNISPRDRNWQLGFYALAAREKYGKVKMVILDMLKQERPLEFQIDDFGNANCVSSKFIDSFNINNVRDELVQTARAIQEAYKKGFKPCPIEKNCEFCNEYVYGL